MCPLCKPWFVVGLVLASALLLRMDSSAFAQEATVYPESETLVPYQGLRNCGVTITSGVDDSQTTIPISEPDRLRVGQIVETQDASHEIMEITGLGGTTMTVNRGVLGTTPSSHGAGTVLYADFTQVKVKVSDVGYRPTGATLTTAIDDSSLDNSGAFLVQSVDTDDTTIPVSDATLLTSASVARFDGASFVSVENGGPDYPGSSFLESSGRSVMCPYYFVHGDNIEFGCVSYHLPPPGPDGPNGNGVLAEVRLRAERVGSLPLDLPYVMLLDATVDANTIFDGAGIGAAITVVSGGAPPPPSPAYTCYQGTTAVCIQPSVQTVNLGDEFSVYVVAEDVTNLGSYKFTLGWSPGMEEMSIQSVHRGYRKDDGSGDYRTNLSSAIDESATVIGVNNSSMLEVGWTALVGKVGEEQEEMLIVGLATGSMTVVRGYNGTTPATHSSGSWVWAGPERMKVTRASLAAPHTGGLDFRADLPVLHVSDHTLLTASALKIDDEWFEVLEIPARTLHDTGLTLDSSIGESDLSLSVTGAESLLQRGWTLQVESELMVVTEEPSGSTVPVARGFFGSQAASHDGGTHIWAVSPEPNTVRVSRGFQGTPIQSHAAGAPITDVDGLGDYAFTMALGSPSNVDVDLVWADDGGVTGFLGQTGRTVQCDPLIFGAGNITLQCDTGSASLPLGATGSGKLATVDVSGRELLDFTPSQTIQLSSVTLHDISGDAIPASVGAGGTVKVVGCPDFNDDGVVDFVGDVMNVAKAYFRIPGYPQEPEHDVNLDGIEEPYVDFVGDVLISAKLALASQPQPLRCPNPPPPP